MAETHRLGRRLLVGAAATGAAVAARGVGVFLTNSLSRSGYEDAVDATWRRGEPTDPRLSAARRDLVRFATLAANSHNTQPWRFRMSGRSVLVLPDKQRRLPAVDPDDHHLFASLGCAVENMVQAAGALGLRAIARFDAAAGGIKVDLETASQIRIPLFNAIPQR